MRPWPLASNWGGKHGEAVAATPGTFSSGYSCCGYACDPVDRRAADHSPRQKIFARVVSEMTFKIPQLVHRCLLQGKKVKDKKRELAREPAPAFSF